jgi:hypothetical protein
MGDTAESSFENQEVDSRLKTADTLNITKQLVSECRHILNHCDDATMVAICSRGEKTISRVYQDSLQREKKVDTVMEKQRLRLSAPETVEDAFRERSLLVLDLLLEPATKCSSYSKGG